LSLTLADIVDHSLRIKEIADDMRLRMMINF